MPKTVQRLVVGLFLTVGILFLVLAYGNYRNVENFVSRAITVSGKVTSLQSHRDSDGDMVYAPIVIFLDRQQREHQIVSDTFTSPPSYEEGQKVTVLYDPKDINNAQIKDFFEQYAFALIFGVLGGILTLIPLTMLFFSFRKEKLRVWLKQNGQLVKAKVIGINLNTSYKVNGRSPYVISAQWQDPSTQLVHVFKSDNFWFDPSQYVKEEVEVYVYPQNPKTYVMVTDTIPQQG